LSIRCLRTEASWATAPCMGCETVTVMEIH